mgnify:CR=1 FL=1
MCTRSCDIGEHAGRAAEYIIFYLHTFVERDIVLDADTIANLHVITYVYILPERAVLAYLSTFLNVAEMPNLCSFANLHAIVNV